MTLHAGTTFLVCDRAGQVARGAEGLYFRDARFLSMLELLLDGQQLLGLSSLWSSPSEGVQIGTNPTLNGVTRGTLALVRRRRLAQDALVDEIAVQNFGDHVATFQLEIKLAADFESIFQIKGRQPDGPSRDPRSKCGPPAATPGDTGVFNTARTTKYWRSSSRCGPMRSATEAPAFQ